MDYPRLAIVDLETTGGDPVRDRITEIAILVTEGDTLIARWSSLLDPGIAIPPRIQSFNGITDEMVRGAPAFTELVDNIAGHCDGATLVAHNARFDYGFLKSAFERCGVSFAPSVLCSVKFSRALQPEHARHGLDAIIARGGYQIAARHRALDDAEIVWRFLQDCRTQFSSEQLQQAWTRAHSRGSAIPKLPAGNIEGLPDGHGVYALFDAQGRPLRVSHVRRLRSQVLGLFTNARDAKSRSLAQRTDNVETWPCAGELDATLQELALKRQLASAGLRVPTPQALDRPWPFSGPVAISEHDEDNARSAVLLFDAWSFLGRAANSAELEALLESPRIADAATQRILARWLASPGNLQRCMPIA